MSSRSPSHNSQKSASNSTKNMQKNNKIFVTSIDIKTPPEEIDAKLRQLFQPKGKIVRIDVKKSFNNKYSFAFVEFTEPEVAAKVLSECKNCEINGKRIMIDYQRSNPRQKKNYLPRQPFRTSQRADNFKGNYPTEREDKKNMRGRDKDVYAQKYPDNKHQRHEKSRKLKRSYSEQQERDRKKRNQYKDDNEHSRKEYREHRKRSPTPQYKRQQRQDTHKRYPEDSHNKAFTGCYNCKSMNHLARECPKGKSAHKQSISSSKSSSVSERRRHERSRRNPKHPELKRREEKRDRQRRYRQYSSDYSSESSSSYRRTKRTTKKNKKYSRRSSSSDSRRKARYH